MSEPSEPNHDVDAVDAPGAEETQGPGQYLRQARLRRGFDLAQVARELRLTPERVRAIENEDQLRLPDAVFVIGYVKSYARLLDLDPEALGEAYRASLSPPSPSPPPARKARGTPAAPERQATRTSKRPSHPQVHESHWAAITALLLVIILGFAWWLQRPLDPSTARPQVDQKPIPDALVPSQTPVDEASEDESGADSSLDEPPMEPMDEPLDEPAEDTEGMEEGGGGVSTASPNLPKGAAPTAAADRQSQTPPEADVAQVVEKLEVVISFTGPTSVDIRDSTMNYGLIGEMDKGDQHLLGGQPPYSMIIGNAAATQITVGGQPFDFRSVVRGNVARFILDPAPKPKPKPKPKP